MALAFSSARKWHCACTNIIEALIRRSNLSFLSDACEFVTARGLLISNEVSKSTTEKNVSYPMVNKDSSTPDKF